MKRSSRYHVSSRSKAKAKEANDMQKKDLHKIFKHKKTWGNSVLSVNLKYWKCRYCDNLIKDDIPFGIVRINGNLTPDVFDTEWCLKTFIIKLEAQKVD